MQTQNRRRMNSASSTDSSYLNQYNFNNLPTFASSKRNINSAGKKNGNPNNSFQADNSYFNFSTTQTSSNKADLPFVPSRTYSINKSFFADSRLPSATNSNMELNGDSKNQFMNKFSRNSLFGSRVWSANIDKAQLNPGFNQNGSKLKADEPQGEFITLIFNFGSLLYLLFSKSGIWLLFMLNFISSIMLDKIRRIPNPQWKKINDINSDDNPEDLLVAESTPRLKKTIFQNIPFSKNDDHDIYDYEQKQKQKTPLFYKKIKGVNVDLNERLQEENKKLEMESRVHEKLISKREQEQEQEVVLAKRKSNQYGTHFYEPKSNSKNTVNLETCYLKSAMKPSNLYVQKQPKDIYSISSDIKDNMLSFYSRSTEERELNKQKINTRPSFTRSTARFQDLEWLVDDKEDYLNNLESTRLFKEYQNIISERKKMQQLLHLSQLKEKGLGVRPLTEDQLEEVEKVWMNQPGGVLISKYGVNITSRDIFTLSDRHWLNDNVIDFYLQMIKDHVNGKGISKIHVFTTFFYTTLKSKGYAGVRKWAKRAKVDVSELDYIFVPVNLNQTHWALAVVDNINERFVYIDSLYGEGNSILHLLMDYMIQETKKNHGDSMNGRNYSMYDIDGDSDGPNQQNGFDCGVFTCTAVDYLARNRELDYSQGDMPDLRRRMAWEILHGSLIDH